MNDFQAEEEVDKIMKSVDKNNSGAIDYTGFLWLSFALKFSTEFVISTINRENLLSKQRLEMAFKMFDKVKKIIFFLKKSFKIQKKCIIIAKQDGSGSLSISELKDVFGGEKISNEIWKDIVKEVDDNGDGEVILLIFW